MAETYHKEHLLDRAAMLAMRALVKLHPPAEIGPNGRLAFEEMMGRVTPAEGVTYASATIGNVLGWWCRAAETIAGAAILYLHGGAYVVGSAASYRNFAGQIAACAKTDVFVADYSLAPERPFPAAVDDAEAAYRGLADAGFTRIAIVGDSAGGGLALVTLAQMTAAAGNGLPRPAAAVALSPWTDLALSSESMTSRAAHDPFLTVKALDESRQLYLGRTDPKDPLVSPVYGKLDDLPPVLLHVGEDEILLDDARRYAAAKPAAVELHVWQGMPHVFMTNPSMLQAAREALGNIGPFLRQHLGG